MIRVLAALVAPLLAAGCGLAPFEPVVGGRDAGLDADAPGVDAGTDGGAMGDAGTGGGGSDAGIDAGAPDGGPPDAGVPDAGRPSCDDVFGSSRDYMLCAERGTECEFFVTLDFRSCADECGMRGTTCIDAYGEVNTSKPCTRGARRGCGSDNRDLICICTRP